MTEEANKTGDVESDVAEAAKATSKIGDVEIDVSEADLPDRAFRNAWVIGEDGVIEIDWTAARNLARQEAEISLVDFIDQAVDRGWISEQEGLDYASRKAIPTVVAAARDAVVASLHPDDAQAAARLSRKITLQLLTSDTVGRTDLLIAPMQVVLAGLSEPIVVTDEDLDEVFGVNIGQQ